MAESIVGREAGNLTKEYMSSYSKYVAQNRAIPSLCDGLKPSQRRCLNSADDLKIYHNRKFMKSAKLEGQVVGDYHPHGGVSLSGLVQPFKLRYPILEGQGNWGCPDDPGSIAASRYTEVRLTKFAEEFYLTSRDYADRELNYDGRLQEVVQYYPPIPGVLLTSAEGIAIGLTTKIPPHNIGVVCKSLLAYIAGEDYLDHFYPDTCEDSVLLSSVEEVKKLYLTGETPLRYKAALHYEDEKKLHRLVVDAFPPGFSRKRLNNPQILQYVDDGKLSLQNESSTGIRYVFTSPDISILKEVEALLESSVSYKLHIEHQGVVGLYTLERIYAQFVEARQKYIIRKYSDLREKVESEILYCEALLKVKDPEVIHRLIDLSESQVLVYCLDHLGISNEVAKRILSTPLRSLTKDNTEKIKAQLETYREKVVQYSGYVEDPISKMVSDIEELRHHFPEAPKSVWGIHEDSRTLSYHVKDDSIEVVEATVADLESPEYSRLDCEYYLIHDDAGFVVVTQEVLKSKLPDTLLKYEGRLKGVYGFDDYKRVHVVYGKDTKVKLGDWCLRKRSGRLVCIESNGQSLTNVVVE